MRYYLYSFPTDMRRSFYTLSGMVTNLMGRNVQDGDVYIFINRPCNSMKILHMEFGGLVIYHLKLESGSFKLPVYDANTNTFQTAGLDDFGIAGHSITQMKLHPRPALKAQRRSRARHYKCGLHGSSQFEVIG